MKPSSIVLALLAALTAVFAAAALSSCKSPEANARLEAVGARLIEAGAARLEREISGK